MFFVVAFFIRLKKQLGKELKKKFEDMGIETRFTTSHNQIRDLPGDTDAQKYRIAKSSNRIR